MKFSVVIPCFNAADTLPRCLQGLREQTCADFELILVDNRSTDPTPDLLQQFTAEPHPFPVQTVHEPRQGIAAARNAGIRHASGDWVVCTDSDCIPDPNWLAEYAAELPRHPPGTAALAGRIGCAPTETPWQTCAGLFTLPPVTEARTFHQLTLAGGGFPTANLAIRRDALLQAGAFPEGHTDYGEDYALCARLYAIGQAIHAFPGATVRHIHRRDPHSFRKQAFHIGIAHAFILKELVPPQRMLDLPLFGKSHRPLRRGRYWIDLQQADKKTALLLLLALCWLPLALLLPLYALHLIRFTLRQSRKRGLPLPRRQAPAVAFALLVKSAALTAGRIRGSLRYRVCCI